MNISYLTEASLAIQIHAATALLALALGIFMWVQPKGTARHKLMGRGFVMVMLIVAISAYFIRSSQNGDFSWIHLFIPLTFFGTAQAIYYIRKGDIKRHIRSVQGLFFGALLIPGIFAFMPGRRLWMVFFG